jgi:hypothetical protein
MMRDDLFTSTNMASHPFALVGQLLSLLMPGSGKYYTIKQHLSEFSVYNFLYN